jgi:hypothetical protein
MKSPCPNVRGELQSEEYGAGVKADTSPLLFVAIDRLGGGFGMVVVHRRFVWNVLNQSSNEFLSFGVLMINHIRS